MRAIARTVADRDHQPGGNRPRSTIPRPIFSGSRRGCSISSGCAASASVGVYHCPFHPTAGIGEYRRESFDRKPNPGMILKARTISAWTCRESVLLGDKDSDVEAGRAAGVRYNVKLVHDAPPERRRSASEFTDLHAIGAWLGRDLRPTFARIASPQRQLAQLVHAPLVRVVLQHARASVATHPLQLPPRCTAGARAPAQSRRAARHRPGGR